MAPNYEMCCNFSLRQSSSTFYFQCLFLKKVIFKVRNVRKDQIWIFSTFWQFSQKQSNNIFFFIYKISFKRYSSTIKGWIYMNHSEDLFQCPKGQKKVKFVYCATFYLFSQQLDKLFEMSFSRSERSSLTHFP